MSCKKDLTSDPRLHVEIFEEYLESWRLSQDPAQRAQALEARYSGKRFDVVFADGTGSLNLLLNHPPPFLSGTPVVFLSVPTFHVPLNLPAHITGVSSHVDYAGTVRLAQTLQPDLQHLYYVDSEPLSEAVKNGTFQREFQSVRDKLDITYWENDDLGTLLKKVSNLPPHSAVLFDTYFEDPSGQTYLPAQVCALVATSANAPVYTVYRTMIGTGAVGGVVVNFEAVGRQGAKIALGLMRGAKMSDFPVEESPNDMIVDWRAFERFEMSEAKLPASTIVLYRESGAWRRYWWYVLAAALVVFVQTVLIVKLAIEGKRRKASEKSARELAGRLIHAQEEERRRIAGELHDDVSQRLALVCLQIDTMRGSPPKSQETLVRELSVLYDETDLISSDIHQFSRELHPSILERLGLIAALRRYCSEFSLHRKIAVNMEVHGEEPRVHADTALALFRVGQECLMNIAKHSDAVSCDVTLNYMHDRVTLDIEDHGSGFDPKELRENSGLGIESMRERLHSVGGTFSFDTAPLRGTRVHAEAPITCATEDDIQVVIDDATEGRPNIPAA